MPVGLPALTGAHDMLLVLATAAIAFGFGAVSAGIGAKSLSVLPTASATVFPTNTGRATCAEEPRASAAWRAFPNTNEIAAAARVTSGQAREAEPRDRFAGDGPGRRGATAGRDPYDRRGYLLESASLLHRRGWIGLSTQLPTVAGDNAPSDSE